MGTYKIIKKNRFYFLHNLALLLNGALMPAVKFVKIIIRDLTYISKVADIHHAAVIGVPVF